MTEVFKIVKRGRGNFTFLIVPNGSNVSICDSDGNNYGSYFSFASFEKMAEENGGFEKLVVGKVTVGIIPQRS